MEAEVGMKETYGTEYQRKLKEVVWLTPHYLFLTSHEPSIHCWSCKQLFLTNMENFWVTCLTSSNSYVLISIHQFTVMILSCRKVELHPG